MGSLQQNSKRIVNLNDSRRSHCRHRGRKRTAGKPGQQRFRANDRAAFTMLEMMLACTVLVVIMTFVTTICMQISFVWKDIAQYRVATSELSNQLDRLTRLEPREARDASGNIVLSEEILATLPEASIHSEVSDSELGLQIKLSLQWKRRNAGKPVELVGWIPSTNGEMANDAGESVEAKDSNEGSDEDLNEQTDEPIESLKSDGGQS